MPVHGSAARLYAAGYDLTGYFRGGNPAYSADVADASVWGVGSKQYVVGKTDASFSGEGIYDADMVAGGKSDDVLSAMLGAAADVLHLPQGDGVAKVAYLFGGPGSTYEITSPGDDVTSFTFEVQSSRGAGHGRVLKDFTGTLPITANGNGTNVDDQSYQLPEVTPGATTKGGVGQLQVINKGGSAGTLTVTIESSVNGSTGWATILTFTGVTAKNKSETLEVAVGATINRYLRAVWALTGGTWDICVAFARKQ